MTGFPGARAALFPGATGFVGSACLELLLEGATYDCVRAIVRRPIRLQNPRPDIRIVRVDDPEGSTGLLTADHLSYELATTIANTGSREAFRHCDPAGGGALRELGVDPGPRLFYYRVMGEPGWAVQQLGYPSLTILRPSPLLGELTERRLAELHCPENP